MQVSALTVPAHRPVLALPIVLAACLTAACRPDAAPAPAAPDPDTWAVVDGRPLTRDDVEMAFRRIGPGTPLSHEEGLAARLSLLNDLILQDIVLARARELNLQVSESELNAAYDEARKAIPDDAFQKELARRNLTPADMREGLRRELLVQKVVEQEVGAKITVTDQEVRDFFEANRAQFNLAEDAYHLAQIVVTPERVPQLANRTGDDAATPQTAAAKAQMLMARLKEGASFRDLAMDYSEDPESAPRGGDLGFVPVSALKQVPPQLRDAVLKSTPGTVRLVSQGGVHTIVLVVAHEKAGQRDLSMPEVRESITNTLRDRKEQLLRAAYLEAARTDANVVNYLARRLVETEARMPGFAPQTPGR